jgi:hypothetical protein
MADSIQKAPEVSEATEITGETTRLTSFTNAKQKMIATNDTAYQSMN